MAAHGLDDWRGQLDDARRRFGVCRMRSKVISISRPLCELNTEAEIRDTILHEIAHALAWQRHGENCGHDARWKEICLEVGARPVASYDDKDVVEPDAPWVLAHKETGEVFRSYFKRPKRDWSKIWIRGRKEDTFGKLEIRPACSSADTGNTAPNIKNSQSNTSIESFDKNAVEKMRYEALLSLKSFAKDRGVEVDISRTKFNSTTCEITFRFDHPTPEGVDNRKSSLALWLAYLI